MLFFQFCYIVLFKVGDGLRNELNHISFSVYYSYILFLHINSFSLYKFIIIWFIMVKNYIWILITRNIEAWYINSIFRWRARRTKINMISVSQVGDIKKKVSFQFSFKTVQRKFGLCRMQMHWECIPGSGWSEVEFTRTYRLGFRPRDWQRPF